MIDFLSNPDWINPQIDFLIFLQNFRIGHLECLDKFFLTITVLGEFWLPTLICAIVYWCVDFRAGIYLFTLEGLNVLFAHFFKMLACVYRPWVLNENLHPSELAVPYAKGYSFPSGHSAMTSSVVGGLAFLTRKKILLCISLVFLVLLVGFSRLWLGVHTPQDVICGLLTGLILIFGVNSLISWAEKNSNRYLYIAAIVDILAILAFIYINFFNTYRMDYVDGNLLVDPEKAKYTAVIAATFALGLMNGCFLCRKFFPFNPKEYSLKTRIIIGVVGAILLLLLLKFSLLYLFLNTVAYKFSVPILFIIGLFITLFYPMLFTWFCSIRRRK